MQYNVSFPAVVNDVFEDDIDILFQHLEPVEPPPSFVAHMLEQITAYAAHTTPKAKPILSNQEMPLLWDELDSWFGEQRKRSLC